MGLCSTWKSDENNSGQVSNKEKRKTIFKNQKNEQGRELPPLKYLWNIQIWNNQQRGEQTGKRKIVLQKVTRPVDASDL